MSSPTYKEIAESSIVSMKELGHKNSDGKYDNGVLVSVRYHRHIATACGKQVARAPYLDSSDERTLIKCPICKYIFVTRYADGSLCGGRESQYCPECGQKINWGNE